MVTDGQNAAIRNNNVQFCQKIENLCKLFPQKGPSCGIIYTTRPIKTIKKEELQREKGVRVYQTG
jgi:hypothetical protein